jgi:hypothetical protein
MMQSKKYPIRKFILLVSLFSMCSCIVNAPKFTTIEKVLTLHLGMSSEEVSCALGIPPYNFILHNDSVTVLLYKFRVSDRTTLPFLLRETNGRKVRGRYVNLLVTYDKRLIATKMESCDDCDPTIVNQKKIDINKVITFITVTLPVLLVYLGIRIGTK